MDTWRNSPPQKRVIANSYLIVSGIRTSQGLVLNAFAFRKETKASIPKSLLDGNGLFRPHHMGSLAEECLGFNKP
jgi:hypothetical protein